MLLVTLYMISVQIMALFTFKDARAGVKNICSNYTFSACKIGDL